MPGQAVPHRGANLVGQFLCRHAAGRQNDESLYDFRALRIRRSNHSRQHNLGMPHDGVFNFRRPDPIPGTGDDVVLATAEPEVTLVVALQRDRP